VEIVEPGRAIMRGPSQEECPIGARPEFLQGNDIESADQFAASLINHQVGANRTVRSLTRTVAQMTVILIRDGAPPEAAACRALAVGDLVIAAWERHHARAMN
jgi:hypothetical protein